MARWTKINPDGTFKFDSLPAGHLDMTAICDGFKSKDGPGKMATFCIPQVFEITNRDLNISIAMEPTANFEVKVIDEAGRPLSDATVAFWPNVAWTEHGSSIFMGWCFNSAETWESSEDFDYVKLRKAWGPVYTGQTDKSGKTIVSNLPAFRQWFVVTHTNFEMPIEPVNNMREARADLVPGETTHATVKLQKKGTDYLQAPP